MSDMKCPFCQQELDTSKYYIRCHNPHCNTTTEMEGTEEMWNALVQTYKALEIAIKYIKYMQKVNPFLNPVWFYRLATEALEQITALEQKEQL